MNRPIFFIRASHRMLPLALCVTLSTPLLQAASAQEMLRLPDFTLKLAAPAAAEGDREALYILANVYFTGKRVPRDYSKAEALLTQAAEQGLALAQLHLAEMYFEGSRVPQNDAASLRWYQMAALQGLPLAQYGLGNIYAKGQGTPVNDTEALRWYEQAAMQGHALSQYELGLRYATGMGATTDLIKGYMWLSLAAAQENPQAISGRDNVRGMMTPEMIGTAQRNSRQFRPTPHYNSDELNRQSKSIFDRAQTIIDSK